MVEACTDSLPNPTVEGYSYSVDVGLSRTPMADGSVRQRRRYAWRPHYINLRWVVSAAQLQTLLDSIMEAGYTDGLLLPIITAANGSAVPYGHTVRIIADPTVTAIERDIYEVAVQGDIGDFDPACIVATNCSAYSACLDRVAFTALAVPQATWDAIAAAWGDVSYWGNPNT